MMDTRDASQISAENRRLVLDAFGAFNRGDIPAVVERFSPTIRWSVGGRGNVSGDKLGPDGVVAYFGRLMTETGGSLRPEPVSSASSEDGAVVVTRTTATRPGKTLDVTEVLMFHIRDGLIIEVYQIQFDQYAWDDFWS